MLKVSPSIQKYSKVQLKSFKPQISVPVDYKFGIEKTQFKPILMSETLSDLDYKNTICKAANIANVQIHNLKSVIGPQELKRVVKENSNNRKFWVPGERPAAMEAIPDSYGLENVFSKDFGASIHIHTVRSDGQLTVEEVLNQAAKYADKYAQNGKGRFIVGITDHNTVDGCKDAVKILASNPEKYKNLGVVLGSEISTKERSIAEYQLRKPEKLHVLALCVNPFDKEVNSFFSDLATTPKTPMFPKEINVKTVVDAFSNQKYGWFSLAHPAYPDMQHRVKTGDDYCDATAKTIKHFKDTAKDKALYVENYYASYFGNLNTDKKLKKTIEQTCDALNLYKAGGIDTHGDSIFYSSNKCNAKRLKTMNEK